MAAWRQTLRALGRNIGFSTVTVITLALGIAATVTVFSLVNGVLLRQLPFPEAERVLEVDHEAPGLALDNLGLSARLYAHYVENGAGEVFEELALYNGTQVTLTGEAAPVRLNAARVTPSLFRVLRVPAALGRTFAEEEGQLGAPAVAVIGHALWQGRFGGDPAIVGRTVRVDGSPVEVIGVMPPGFVFPRRFTDVWLPRPVDVENEPLGAFGDSGLARLRDGVDQHAALAFLTRLTDVLPTAFEGVQAATILHDSGFRPHLLTRLERVVGAVRSVMWTLLAAVGLILTITCANVANLFLVRVEERGNELAVRSALGASRGRLVGGLMAESVALAMVAGGLGLALAWAALQLVVRYGSGAIPRLEEVGLDATVVAFALLVSLAAGLTLGLVPALRGTRSRLAAALREGGRAPTVGRQRHRLRNVLVVAQMALGLVLLVACGLVVRSFQALSQVDPGFRADGVYTFRLSLPESDYQDGAARVRFAEQAQARLAALPGVHQAAVIGHLPLGGSNSGSGYEVESAPVAEGGLPPVFMETNAGPDYLQAMGVALLEGRFPNADDHRLRTGNVAISASIAERYWPEGRALGQRIKPGRDEDPWYTVVGVVGDVHHFGLAVEPVDMVYAGLLGREDGDLDLPPAFSLVLRTDTPLESLATAVRAEIGALDRNLPVTQVQPMSELVRQDRGRLTFAMTVLLSASLMALVIAAVGLYGVVAYLVSRRTHEIGIRMALGALGGTIAGMVLRQGLTVAALGAGIGLAVSLVVTRWLGALLYGVGVRDPLSFAAAPLALVAVALLATLVPAWRAARIAPLEALRHE